MMRGLLRHVKGGALAYLSNVRFQKCFTFAIKVAYPVQTAN